MKIFFGLFFSIAFAFLFLANPIQARANDVCCPANSIKDATAQICYRMENGVREPVVADNICGPNQVCDNASKGVSACVAESSVAKIFGQVIPPGPVGSIGFGGSGIGNLLSKIIELAYIAAAVIFVFMIIISAFQWLISGGDKDAVSGARKRLIYAIVGITVLALAFLITGVVGQITGFQFFNGYGQTTTSKCTPGSTCGVGGNGCVLGTCQSDGTCKSEFAPVGYACRRNPEAPHEPQGYCNENGVCISITPTP